MARRAAAVIVALAVAGAGASACSDDEAPALVQPTAAPSTTDASVEAGPAPGPSSGEDDPRSVGGTLRLGITRLPSLDPADASPESPSAAIAADLLYDGLTSIAPAGDGVAQPELAERWETLDAVTWQFFLRPGATFADGRAVTAADVEASLERVAARGGGSLAAARLDVLADVRALDPATVEIVLDRPMATLPELLSAPTYGIVVAEIVAGGGDPAFNSSGPFRVTGRDGDVLHLVRARAGTAFLDGVELHQFDALGDAVDAFEAGELDWTLVPPDRAEAVAEAHGSDGFVPFQAELFFGFNLRDPTFADARFRRAIVAAVDRAAVVGAVYFGIASTLDTVVPLGVPGADPSRCGAGCRTDPDLARQLLAEAFPTGAIPEVFIDHEEIPEETALAQAVEQQLEAVGIPATLRPHASESFGAFAVSGGAALVRLGWVGVWPGQDAYVEPLFRTAAPDNVTGYTDPAVDQLLDAAARSFDAAERVRLLGEAEALVLAAAAIVPIAQFHLLSVAAPHVHDLVLGVGGTFDAEAVWLG